MNDTTIRVLVVLFGQTSLNRMPEPEHFTKYFCHLDVGHLQQLRQLGSLAFLAFKISKSHMCSTVEGISGIS